MVNTRSQYVDSYAASSSRMEQNSDNESKNSFPEVLSRNQMNEFDDGDIINSRQNHNSSSVDQRFMKMNRQISDLTSIVMALTEKISSSTNECNGLITVNNPNVTRSDSHHSLTFNFEAFFDTQNPQLVANFGSFHWKQPFYLSIVARRKRPKFAVKSAQVRSARIKDCRGFADSFSKTTLGSSLQ